MADDSPGGSDSTPGDAPSAEERGQLLDSLPIGVGVQCAGRIEYLNPVGARILGGEVPSEFVGRAIMDFVHPDHRDAMSRRVEEMTASGGTTLERRYVFLDLQGREVPVVVTTTQITFRGRAGTQVAFSPPGLETWEQEELRRLRKAVDSSSDIVFMTDAEGVFTFVNPEFTRVYGHAPEDLLGKETPRILKGGLTPPEAYDYFWKTILAGQVVRGELVNKTRSGELLTIDGSANPVFDEAGAITGFIAIQRDVTERQKKERLLHLTQFSLDHALDANYWLTSDGKVHLANEAASTLLGYSRQELDAMPVWEFDPTMSPDGWRAAWTNIKRTGSGRRESVHRGRDGVGIPVEVSAKFIEYDGAEYVFASARDTRERDVLTAQLQQAQKMEAVGQLAGGIAHDFNNLLAAILCYADFVTDSVEEHDPIAADVAEIRGAADRAVGLTRQLLAFSRKQVMQTTTFDLREVVAGLEKILGRVIGEDVNLDVRASDEPLFVEADVGQIEQVVMNLAVNARDAMPAGGVLELTLGEHMLDETFGGAGPEHRRGPVVCLAIRDTGVGMDRETGARVFEPFFTTKSAGRGTGLGLSTVYGIVKQSGGFIDLVSELGVGTTVTVWLPKASGVAASESLRPVSTAPRAMRGTVLLAEDDPAVRLVAHRALNLLGLTVLVASGPGEALLLHEQHPDEIDLLLSDVVMPTISGLELANRLVARQPTLRVLLMTGYVDDREVEGLAASRFDVLRKPFTPASLRERVDAAFSAPAPGSTP